MAGKGRPSRGTHSKMARQKILDEVKAVVEQGIDAGRIVVVEWAIHKVLLAHPFPRGTMAEEEHDFNETCRHEHIGDTFRKVLKQYKEDPAVVSAKGGYLPMPGFEYLQRAYPLTRDDELVIVPIKKMAWEEGQAKIKAYRVMGTGCFAHADEMERWFGPDPSSAATA